jgi:hypothetical protein
VTVSQEYLHALFNYSPGLMRVLTERQRHFDKEYTIEHDRSEHSKGGLVTAARAYIWAAQCLADRIAQKNPGRRFLTFIPFQWPWTNEDWKPDLDSPTENLVRAASLLVAEIDRRIAEGLD